jgi:hypothetical protein
MTWQTDMAGDDSLPTQQQFPLPAQGGVPMEEQVVRANRFVSQLGAPTVMPKPPQNNSKVRHLRLARQRVLHLRSLLDSAEVLLAKLQQEYSGQRSDPTSPTVQEYKGQRGTR